MHAVFVACSGLQRIASVGRALEHSGFSGGLQWPARHRWDPRRGHCPIAGRPPFVADKAILFYLHTATASRDPPVDGRPVVILYCWRRYFFFSPSSLLSSSHRRRRLFFEYIGHLLAFVTVGDPTSACTPFPHRWELRPPPIGLSLVCSEQRASRCTREQHPQPAELPVSTSTSAVVDASSMN